METRLLCKHFCLQPFFPKIQFLDSLLSSLSLNLGLQFAGKYISDTFSDWRRIACNRLSGTAAVYSFIGVQGKVDQKSQIEKIEFHNSIQDEFLPPFTGCRKVLRKIPGNTRTICEICSKLTIKTSASVMMSFQCLYC